MQKEQFLLILDKYLKGRATAAEQDFLFAYYNLFQADPDVMKLLEQDEQQKLKLAIKAGIDSQINGVVKLYPRIKIAAAIAAAVTAMALCIYFFTAPNADDRHPELVSGSQDIAPGRSGATITLASGQVIQLSGAKRGVVVGEDLKYDDGSEVQVSSGSQPAGSLKGSQRATGPVGDPSPLEAKNSMTLTASTSKGQTYEFTLPDGTHVWLNADSKLNFPSQFSGKERKILLSGEAYFDVVHNAKQPFRVESKTADGKGQTVEDIGTEFNISAYPDDTNVKTTLVEGSAEVYTPEWNTGANSQKVPGMRFILEPNRQSVLADGKLKVKTVNVEQAVAWKDGNFMFAEESIEQIMNKVARWYDVDVVYQGERPDQKYSGITSRAEHVSQILGILEGTKTVKFSIAGRKIIVSKK